MDPSEHGEEMLAQEIPLTIEGMAERSQSTTNRVVALERETTQLRREVASLRQLVLELQRQLAAPKGRDAFVEYRGALFKRNDSGGFHEGVFCPNCLEPMRSPQNELNFNCRSCQAWVNIKGHELSEVLHKVSGLNR